ncbi:phage DNA ejection protein [Klebsiella aerogenes]|uniref:phage DNA ejection protein n=1 Tax=Klebsiella aerogenes TaxID=548 RepID=UPI001E033E23|nr:phage DNA ejection protein [Klebsiella aerogenes]MCB8448223.1 phage DNA ejection protein [Klebsiella aerogenes]MCB8452304.1 phage DNA ejection protein [Klebsiella aerogenes]
MATWQQGINSGGFLAGIGQNNQNAPQASDANTALEYIRQNNENEWSGRNNVGLQALNGIAGNLQLYKQAQQAGRQSEFQQAYGNAFASGDRNAMRQLAAQYPDQIDAVRNGMKFVDEDQRNTVGNLAAGARLASTSPDSMMSWLQNNAADLQRVGLNPMEVAQTYQQNPKAFSDFADHLGMAALGPDQYFNVQDKIAGNAITMRGQDISQQNAAQNNAVAMRGQDIQANLGQQRIDLDRENNRINMENKRYERQLQNETNDLKRQELQQKIDSNNQALQQKKNDLNSGYKDSINTLTTSMGTLNDILSSPSLKSVTGIRGAIPNIPGSAAADVQARLDTFKSQAFLSAVAAMKGMGALSDAEGKKLDAAVGSLQNSQSEDAFKRNGKIIMDMYNQKRNDAVSKYVQQNGIQRVTAPQQSIDYLRQHPELSADFINRYGYLPPIGG